MHVHVSTSSSLLKSARNLHNAVAPVVSLGLTITDQVRNETLKKLRNFKKFDTVSDTSDHYFVNHSYFAEVRFRDGLCFSSIPNYMDLHSTYVIYLSGGHRLNPNFYEDGKVCLNST